MTRVVASCFVAVLVLLTLSGCFIFTTGEGAVLLSWTGGDVTADGVVDLGSTESTLEVVFTITNVGNGDLLLPDAAVDLSTAPELSVSQPSDGPLTLEPDATATFTITMTDSNTTAAEPVATVTLTFAEGETFAFTVTGVTGAPEIAMQEFNGSWEALNDGDTHFWSTSTAPEDKIFRIDNLGDAPLEISDVNITKTGGTLTLAVVSRPEAVDPGTTEDLILRMNGGFSEFGDWDVKVVNTDADEGEFTFSVVGDIC